jgi:hypothetical protein
MSGLILGVPTATANPEPGHLDRARIAAEAGTRRSARTAVADTAVTTVAAY